MQAGKLPCYDSSTRVSTVATQILLGVSHSMQGIINNIEFEESYLILKGSIALLEH